MWRDAVPDMAPVAGNRAPAGSSELDKGTGRNTAPAAAGSVEPGKESDSELMLAYGLGVYGAFEKLYERHNHGLLHFFVSGTGDHALSLDLYQDTWARVIKKRQDYVATARFSTWLYTIARNVLIDHYRRTAVKGVSTEFEDEGLHDGADTSGDVPLSPEEVAVLGQRAEGLQEALDCLPIKQKEVILLRHIAGMSLAEICQATGDEYEAVKSRLRYAVAALRTRLRVVK